MSDILMWNNSIESEDTIELWIKGMCPKEVRDSYYYHTGLLDGYLKAYGERKKEYLKLIMEKLADRLRVLNL